MTIVKFDQHFMIDKKIIKIIIKEANICEKDTILEIGPGRGAITKEISKIANSVVCIEIDKENEKYLQFEDEKCKVIYGNALELIWNVSFNKIISNLPYVIIEPLFKKLTKINFDLCVFTITKNYYDLLCDKSKKLHYFINSYFDIKYVCDVDRNCFNPAPKVDSCVISVSHKKEITKYMSVIRSICNQDDKLLKNALLNIFWNDLQYTKKEAKEIISKFGLDEKTLSTNVSVLSNEQFVIVANEIEKHMINFTDKENLSN